MKRGRKSAGELAVVTRIADARPAAPAELTGEQADEWRAVVNRLPQDWFPRETHAILKAYCRHTSTVRLITEEIDRFEAEWLCDPEDAGLKRLDKLTAMRERESRAMIAAARALRITEAAQIRPEAAGRAARDAGTGRKPWDGFV